MPMRPSFIVASRDLPEHSHVYPQSEERMGPVRRLGRSAGLQRIGVNLQRLPPGMRSSWPHAEELEEEFVYIVEGEVDAWIDGDIHHLRAGDFAAFPAGTGICHCFLNNGTREALLLVGGDAGRADSRIVYPVNPSRRADLKPGQWWHDAPQRPLGPHDGLTDALRDTARAAPARADTHIAAAASAQHMPLADAAPISFVATAMPDAARAFYATTLGLRLVEDSPFALAFDAAGAMLRVQKVAQHTPAGHTAAGWRVADIRATVRSLAARGVQFERYATLAQDELGVWDTPSGARVAWFRDPDGNTLSLTEWPAPLEAATAGGAA